MSKKWWFMMDSYLKNPNNLFGTGIHPRCTRMTCTSTYIMPIHHLRSTEKNTCSSQFQVFQPLHVTSKLAEKKHNISFGFTTQDAASFPSPDFFFNICLLEGILIDKPSISHDCIPGMETLRLPEVWRIHTWAASIQYSPKTPRLFQPREFFMKTPKHPCDVWLYPGDDMYVNQVMFGYISMFMSTKSFQSTNSQTFGWNRCNQSPKSS